MCNGINFIIFCRGNFTPNKSKQVEARKASLSLAVDDLRIAIQKGNIAAVQKYLDDGKRCTVYPDSIKKYTQKKDFGRPVHVCHKPWYQLTKILY